MLFGDLIARLSEADSAEELLLGFGDLPLLNELRIQAHGQGLDVGAYAANAVNRYAAQASEEEWLTLMGVLGRTGDPGLAYLKRAIAFCGNESAA